jgi:DNA-binding HxlR family transcriptional regulator
MNKKKEKEVATRPLAPRCGGRGDRQTCDTISDMLARIGDKWSLLIVSTLGDGALRFNELRRRIGDISQKMLSSNLKALERDGMITRTVASTVPPQVEYELTDLGRELFLPVLALAQWTERNTPKIVAARAVYDARLADVESR